MRTRFFTTVFSFLFFVCVAFFSSSSVYAFENPHYYYDWNTYTVSQNVLGVRAFAQEATETASNSATPPLDYHDVKGYDGYILGVGNMNPDNPFYFFKKMQENIALTFTFDPKVREERRLGIAGERVLEIEEMIAKGKGNLVGSLAREYANTMEGVSRDLTTLKEQKANVIGLLATTDIEGAKQMLVLEEISLKTPTEGIQSIDVALAASEKTVDTVADIVGRPAVPAELSQRIEALKAQGLLTDEEAQKIISASSRVAAREELRKLAEGNIVPQADLKKFDEAARSYFPQGYVNVLEIKKFKELRDLETEKPDDTMLRRVQEFAKEYTPGDVIPSDLRRWWVPMVRLEELQNTIRPDLINPDFFKYRPEDQQKYNEVVERLKPREEDVNYVNQLLERNSDLINDPAFARIKAIGDKFGTADVNAGAQNNAGKNCGTAAHWVYIPYMPNGGYCVPNITYAAQAGGGNNPCPPGYHRNEPGGACFPNTTQGNGQGYISPSTGLSAAGTCYGGYHWVADTSGPRGGYCASDYTSYTVGGAFPNPIAPPSYCPTGQMFQDGRCVTYNPPPQEGCPSGQYWTGTRCVEIRTCPAGQYQNSNGDCTQSSGNFPSPNTCQPSANGCGANLYWDYMSCSCRSTTTYPGITSAPGQPGPTMGYQCTAPANGCPSGWTWVQSACSCNYTSSNPPPPGTCNQPSGGCPSGWYWNASACSCNPSGGSYTPPSPSTPNGSGNCGSGYTWNGNYCAPNGSSNTTQPQPGTMSRSNQEAGCTAGGGTCNWNGDMCNCQGYQSPSSSSQPSSQTQSAPTTAPQPQQSAPQPQPTQPPQTPPQGMDPATECSKYGGTWANGTCTMPQ